MTQEEKAKRYEQTLERAREAKQNTESAVTIGILEEIFPELKENEDERIRKELIEFVKSRGGFKQEYIAWLEKQGEPTEINPSEFDLHLNKLLKQFESLPKEELISNLSYYLNVIQNDGTYKIEKQGEQESITIDDDPVASYNNVMISDAVEPKFHEGDWVVYKNDICQIVKREEGCNKLVTVFGIEKELVNERNLSTARLWTIQDAKDGDVLADNGAKIIFIFKNTEYDSHIESNVIKYFIRYSFDGINLPLENGGHLGVVGEYSDFVPATKEQRDLLFQKMKEAGYEWDAEKKELKKIEQKPAWREEDEDLLTSIEDSLSDYLDYIREDRTLTTKGMVKLRVLIYVEWLKSFKDRVQPKQEWSEEDEVNINRIVACLENLNVADNDILLKDIDWLNSLKERIGG